MNDYTPENEEDRIHQYEVSLYEHFIPNIDTVCMYYRYVIKRSYEHNLFKELLKELFR